MDRQPTDPTYSRRANPPQVEGEVFVCSLCSAVVEDPKRHTLAIHRGTEIDAAARGVAQPDPRHVERRF